MPRQYRPSSASTATQAMTAVMYSAWLGWAETGVVSCCSQAVTPMGSSV